MKAKIYILILFTALFTLINIGCDENSPIEQKTTYTCDQECQDSYVGYGFANTYNFLWNQYIAGTPTGVKDIYGNGPLGGTVHIFGTTSYSSNGITTVNLTYDMVNCKNANTEYTLTFTGSMACNGTFSSTHNAMVYSSASLTYSGTVSSKTNTPVSGTCAVSIAEDNNGVSGTICGRTFAY